MQLHDFRALARQFPDLTPLRSVLTSLTLPRQQHSETDDVTGSSTDAIPDRQPRSDASRVAQMTSRPSSPWPTNQLAPFLSALSRGDGEGKERSFKNTNNTPPLNY